MTKRYICGHQELIPTQWNQTKPEPCEVVGCCPMNYSCPICGFGAGTIPHNECEGWDEEKPEPLFGNNI